MFLSKVTFLILAQRGWQSLSGILTLIIISTYLTPDEQGWYYAFISIAAFYSVFEMGLASAILQVSAHIFSGLSWGKRGRLLGNATLVFESFVKKSVKTYLKLAVVFSLVVLPFGAYVFGAKENVGSAAFWLFPWIFVIMGTALSMLTLPFLAIVEGSGEIREVYLVRIVYGICGSIVCWATIYSGGYLWAAGMMPIIGFLISAIWLSIWKPSLLSSVLSAQENHFDWRSQVWTLQWRVGVSWISMFLMSQLATPILFYFRDPVVAGQIGLTLTIAHMIGILSQSWIARDVPLMSLAVARKDWIALDDIFIKNLRNMIIVFLLCGTIFSLIYAFLTDSAYINRILPFWQTFALLLFVLLYQISAALSTYLRCFRREPLMYPYITGAILVVIGSLWAGINYSSSGIVLVMLAAQGLIVFPASVFIWKKCKQSWIK
jgi:hypothetical protein